MTDAQPNPTFAKLFTDHSRTFDEHLYVYPVISRRAQGLSLGINLNPDKRCNWGCVYCQVDRTTPSPTSDVDENKLLDELRQILASLADASFWSHPRFESTPQHMRVLRDISFAGDGEPTSYQRFAPLLEKIVIVRDKLLSSDIPIIVMTNATLLHKPDVAHAINQLDPKSSRIWCKLDAGSQRFFKSINVSRFSFEHCLKNILELSRQRSIEIQSMLFRFEDKPFTDDECNALVSRLAWLVDQGAQIQRVQLYTIARTPLDSRCTPLSKNELDAISERIMQRSPALRVNVFA